MKIEIKTVVILGLLCFMFLILLSILCQKPHMEKQLAAAVIQKLRSAGHDVDTVTCNERDVILYGSVQDSISLQKVEIAASSIPGVRTVNNQFIIETGSLLQVGLDSLLSHCKVTFENNSHQLAADAFDIIDRIDSLLTQYPEHLIQIIGHTDSEGDSLYNLELSLNRATSVRDELIIRGYSQDRFSVIGMGEGQPITSNEIEEGRKKNRRVEFNVEEK